AGARVDLAPQGEVARALEGQVRVGAADRGAADRLTVPVELDPVARRVRTEERVAGEHHVAREAVVAGNVDDRTGPADTRAAHRQLLVKNPTAVVKGDRRSV